MRDRLRRQEPQRLAGIEARHQHDGARHRRHGPELGDQARHVHERDHDQRALAVLQAVHALERHARVHDVPVGRDGALGPPGRARGVEEQRGGVGGDRLRPRCARPAAPPRRSSRSTVSGARSPPGRTWRTGAARRGAAQPRRGTPGPRRERAAPIAQEKAQLVPPELRAERDGQRAELERGEHGQAERRAVRERASPRGRPARRRAGPGRPRAAARGRGARARSGARVPSTTASRSGARSTARARRAVRPAGRSA